MSENAYFIGTFSIVLASFLLIEFLNKKRKGEKVSIQPFILRFVGIVFLVYIIKLTLL